MGLLLAIVVHSAAIQDRYEAKLLFFKAAALFPTISLVWADGGYAGQLIEWLNRWCGWVLEIVRKPDNQVGFQLLPRRWVVERTFAWLGHSRRLSKDYEELVENSEAMIQIAMIHASATVPTRKTPRYGDSVSQTPSKCCLLGRQKRGAGGSRTHDGGFAIRCLSLLATAPYLVASATRYPSQSAKTGRKCQASASSCS